MYVVRFGFQSRKTLMNDFMLNTLRQPADRITQIAINVL
jgi:hypothetical protein